MAFHVKMRTLLFRSIELQTKVGLSCQACLATLKSFIIQTPFGAYSMEVFLLIIYCYLAEIYSVFLFYVKIYSGQNLATITNA